MVQSVNQEAPLLSKGYQGYKMKHEDTTKEMLIEEVKSLRKQVAELRAAESKNKRVLEDMQLHAEKLKVVGELASGITHEFNNILTIIQGNVQLLEAIYCDHRQLKEGLRIISKASADGAEVVQRILKSITNKGSSKFVPVDIVSLIKQAIDFLRPRWKVMAEARGITYNIDMEGLGQTPSVLGNPSELREALINIINNALDAMPHGGRLAFRTRKEQGDVFVSISDSGVGMPRDVQKRLFEPFFTTKGTEGSGLGMSVTRNIITNHGGKIDVNSEVGKGTTIMLRLPLTQEKVHPVASIEYDQKLMAKNHRILVVDDEPEICRLLSSFLSREGNIVETVDSGMEAINLLKTKSFDLVICDLVMPAVSGWDVMNVLETLDRRPKVGIITGWTDMSKALRTKEPWVDFVLNKPIELHELTRLINDVLDAR